MRRLTRTGKRTVRNRAMVNAARWGMRRLGGRLGRRGSGMLGAAGWALPLGMALYDSVLEERARRRPQPIAI